MSEVLPVCKKDTQFKKGIIHCFTSYLISKICIQSKKDFLLRFQWYWSRTGSYCSDIIYTLAGLGVLAIAIWTVTDKYKYVILLSTVTYPIIAYFLLAAGGLVIFVTILGCCATCKNNRPYLIFYIFLLLLIFLIEAMVGILAYVYEEQVQNELEMNLNTTCLSAYKIDTDKTEAIDFLQEKFHCCGVVSFEDWQYSTWKKQNLTGSNLVPDSCCKTVTQYCGVRNHPSNIYYSGCMSKMAEHMKSHLIILSAVGLGICVLQIFGIIFSCQLYFKLKDYIDEV